MISAKFINPQISECFRSATESDPSDILKLYNTTSSLMNISPRILANSPDTRYTLKVVGAKQCLSSDGSCLFLACIFEDFYCFLCLFSGLLRFSSLFRLSGFFRISSFFRISGFFRSLDTNMQHPNFDITVFCKADLYPYVSQYIIDLRWSVISQS